MSTPASAVTVYPKEGAKPIVEGAFPLPRFRPGDPARVHPHVGLLERDEDYTNTKIKPVPVFVESIRFNADVNEHWDEDAGRSVRVITYPKGWEYNLVTADGSEWGWVPEAELVKRGY